MATRLAAPVAATLLAAVLLAAPAARAADALTLHVDATDGEHRRLRVRETLPVQPGPLTLLYPRWVPGTHAPTSEVKRLSGLEIRGGGQPLRWRRDPLRGHAFELEVPPGVSQLEIGFDQLLPATPQSDVAEVGRRHARIKWHGALLYPAGVPVAQITVAPTLRLPAGWQAAGALPLAERRGDEWRFEPVSLETLVDSPVYAGAHLRRIALDAAGPRPVFLDLIADEPQALEASEAQIEAHRALVRQADRLFGARHFAHYDFLLLLADDHRYDGLEHHQSSENALKPDYFSQWDQTAAQRDLLPHEFAHSWNGKFRRPRGQAVPDFEQPLDNSLLWVYEGQTQYWGLVLAARSGLVAPEQAREMFAQQLAALRARPGRAWRPLADTTADPVVAGRHAPLDWPDQQRFEDYYDEGALVWLEADLRIRLASGGTRSLDDFARGFFGVADGRVEPLFYERADVLAELQRVQAFDWDGFLRRRIDEPAPPLAESLEQAGWRLAFRERPSEFAKAQQARRESDDFRWSLGFSVAKDGRLQSVAWGSPAFGAGLAAGMTLLAVDRRAYGAARLDEALRAAQREPRPIELLLKDGSDYRLVSLDWREGPRHPVLERIEGRADLLGAILAPRP